ncbi:hypothetical protein [Tolypothrix sp. VBCCA 56010]|uniref:hypothetical protein n=1 Tax=Tolypothrix sp. VBCCA 56010 TaxID=3137731 RepID=UPI003D7D5C4A
MSHDAVVLQVGIPDGTCVTAGKPLRQSLMGETTAGARLSGNPPNALPPLGASLSLWEKTALPYQRTADGGHTAQVGHCPSCAGVLPNALAPLCPMPHAHCPIPYDLNITFTLILQNISIRSVKYLNYCHFSQKLLSPNQYKCQI